MTSNLARRDRSADNAFVGEREKRLARNETLYREANERVAEVAAQLLEGETDAPGGFICECDAADCRQCVELELAEYREISADPYAAVLAASHAAVSRSQRARREAEQTRDSSRALRAQAKQQQKRAQRLRGEA